MGVTHVLRRPDGQTRWRISTDLDDYLADMQELAERRAGEDAERDDTD